MQLQNQDHILNIETDDEVNRAVEKNNWISGAFHNVTSQAGEDGVIAKILEIIGIEGPDWCVEFGACDGERDSNTWRLINDKGWSGVLIEPDPGWFRQLADRYKDRQDVHCFNRFVGWEGPDRLDAILASTPLPKDFALLVIDIDGNDYHVWQAMGAYQPQIICIEFNRLIHPSLSYVQPTDSCHNQPASLGALNALGKEKGYELVSVIGWNAFFVRRDHFARFDIQDNQPERMYSAQEEMRLFQGYDGTLRLCGNDIFYWKYQMNEEGTVANVRISQRDIQVLPDALRVFRPRHTYHCNTLAEQAGRLDSARVPANILLSQRRNVMSECGEDGILEAIFTRLGITRGFAVEVGAHDGKWFSQTWNLFAHHGWSGVVIEKDAEAFVKLEQNHQQNSHVRCVHAEVTRAGSGSLDALLAAHEAPGDISFVSIDIEGNDYHIWESMTRYKPVVVAIDFNPTISNDIAYVQAYDAHSPFGASLRALVALGRRKGYQLAAATDWNAIFVLAGRFPELGIVSNHIDDMYYAPFEMRMTQTMDGWLHLLAGARLVRQDYDISFEDFQVLPSNLRGQDSSMGGFGRTPTLFYGLPPKRDAL